MLNFLCNMWTENVGRKRILSRHLPGKLFKIEVVVEHMDRQGGHLN